MLSASEKEKLSEYEALQEKLDKQFECHVDMVMVINAFLEYDAQIRDNENLADAILLTNESALKYRRWKKLDREGKLLELPCLPGDAALTWDESGNAIEGEVSGYEYSAENGFCAVVSGGDGIRRIPFPEFGKTTVLA